MGLGALACFEEVVHGQIKLRRFGGQGLAPPLGLAHAGLHGHKGGDKFGYFSFRLADVLVVNAQVVFLQSFIEQVVQICFQEGT